MAKMKLTHEQVEIIFWELDAGDDEWEGFKTVDKGEWVDEGKYQYKNIVFEYENKLWEFTMDRSGSYFTDYYYGVLEAGEGTTAREVEKKEVTIYKWVAVKDEV